MASVAPDEVVVDLPLGDFAALGIGLVVAAEGSERGIRAASGEHNGEDLQHLRVVVGQKKAGIPTGAGVELIDQTRA